MEQMWFCPNDGKCEKGVPSFDVLLTVVDNAVHRYSAALRSGECEGYSL